MTRMPGIRGLSDAGFRRMRKLHGKTGRAEREEIVDQWRDGVSISSSEHRPSVLASIMRQRAA